MHHKFKILPLLILCFLLSTNTQSQSVQILTKGTKTSLRGLSVVNERVIWASGSGGTVGLSLDSGKNWKWMKVKGFEKTEFRDIEAFDETTAIIMGIASPAYILKTNNAGQDWKVVYENKHKDMFLDAMEFWNEQSGIVIGDPVDHRFFIARSFDGGDNWQEIPLENRPLADSGEACFASSGTNIRKLNLKEAAFISGGSISHLFIRNQKIELAFPKGTETNGANSIAVGKPGNYIIVGGDFNKPDSLSNNCFITKDGGKTFYPPFAPPHGYRSCVEYISKKNWVSCGLNGVDYSSDDGSNWNWISKESFNACRKSKKGGTVFFAGNNGKIGKLIF